MVRVLLGEGIDRDHLLTQHRCPTVWVESHVVRGAGGLYLNNLIGVVICMVRH